MPFRCFVRAPGRIGSLLIMLSLLGGCGAAKLATAPEQSATPIEPTYTPTPGPSPVRGDTRTRATDGMVTVFVPGGSFVMGSTEPEVDDAITLCAEHYGVCNRWYYMQEHPQHPVSLDGFWLDRTEVSNEQYRRCVEAGMCEEPATCSKGTPTYADPAKSDHPVVCVGWQDARAYCHWAGARMPTEAEWEFASRGEQRRIFPWGDLFDGSRLNYCDTNCEANHADPRYDDGFAKTSPAGSYPAGASWIGALGMGGNVSEWVGDWLGSYTPEAQSNPTGPSEGSDKLIKGCSWFSHPTYCRGAARGSVDPGTRFDYLGFRCAASPGE